VLELFFAPFTRKSMPHIIASNTLLAAERFGADIVNGKIPASKLKEAVFKRQVDDTNGSTMASEALWPLAVAAGAGRALGERAAVNVNEAVQAIQSFCMLQLALSASGTWSAGFAAWAQQRDPQAPNGGWETLKKAPEMKAFANAPIEEDAMPEILAVRKSSPLSFNESLAQRRIHLYANGLQKIGAISMQAAIGPLMNNADSALGALVSTHSNFLGFSIEPREATAAELHEATAPAVESTEGSSASIEDMTPEKIAERAIERARQQAASGEAPKIQGPAAPSA